MAVVVDRRGVADDEELFRLYEGVFGLKLTEGSKRRWRWQYLGNPQTSPEGPEIWVAREGDTVLGQYASMPVRLWWGSREVRSSWGMDVFLKPEARGKGIGALLFTAWSDHVEVALGLGLTPSSYGLFKKLRYTDVGPVPFFQKVLDPRAVLRRRVGPALSTAGAPFLALGLRFAQRAKRASKDSVELRPITSFSSEYDTLWERARTSYSVCVRRDAAYLHWKYVACPTQTYELLEARRDGVLSGFAVSRTAEHEGMKLGWILDVFADTADHATKDRLIEHILEGFEARGVARAQAFSMNAALADDLRGRGFRRGNSAMQFCVRSRIENGDVFDRTGGWHVTFGDSDMDR